jgi:hypothetical protein
VNPWALVSLRQFRVHIVALLLLLTGEACLAACQSHHCAESVIGGRLTIGAKADLGKSLRAVFLLRPALHLTTQSTFQHLQTQPSIILPTNQPTHYTPSPYIPYRRRKLYGLFPSGFSS